MDIEKKIEQFYNAELTLQQEQELISYLRENDVPQELQNDKKTILTMSDYMPDTALPEGAEERLVALIDTLEEQEANRGNESVAVYKGLFEKIYKIPKKLYIATAAAAVLLVAFILTYSDKRNDDIVIAYNSEQSLPEIYEQDTFDSPEEALPYVEKLLLSALIPMTNVCDNLERAESSLAKFLTISNSK